METGLSPEQLASSFGVSNMTLRRWGKEPAQKEIPSSSVRSVIEGVYQLISEGRLNSKSPVVQEVIAQSPSQSFQAALDDLGIAAQDLKTESSYKDKAAIALFQIGSRMEHRQDVESNHKRLLWFKKMGQEWLGGVTELLNVTKSKHLSHIEKMVAYGALFYLISPMDLIPDALPFAGVTDDYSFLMIATAYYAGMITGKKGISPRPSSTTKD